MPLQARYIFNSSNTIFCLQLKKQTKKNKKQKTKQKQKAKKLQKTKKTKKNNKKQETNTKTPHTFVFYKQTIK